MTIFDIKKNRLNRTTKITVILRELKMMITNLNYNYYSLN